MSYIGFLIFFINQFSCEESFLLAFQKSKGISEHEWAEYDGDIPHMKGFTVCYWEKLHFFNGKTHNIWAYCTIEDASAGLDCIQFGLGRDLQSAGRDVVLELSAQRGFAQYVTISPFKHRTWNHFCWSYDSLSGENKIYANGVLHQKITLDLHREIKGSYEVFGSSFLIGQEPDAFRGGFDARQAFRGNISELNVWDHILKDEVIEELGKCKRQLKGNVISWKEENFMLFNITKHKIEDISTLCIPDVRVVIFPERESLQNSVNLCKAHGGFLHTPDSQGENENLLRQVDKYGSQCTTSSGSTFWLGAMTINYSIIKRNKFQKFVPGNFSNWVSPLFRGNFSCIHMNNKGQWYAEAECEFIELCPVCQFIGTPILTIKGKQSCNEKNANTHCHKLEELMKVIS